MVQFAIDAALERKAQNVVLLDVRGRSSYADYLVVATGTSHRHVQAVAEHVDLALCRQGATRIGREGMTLGEWALIDFGAVVVHIFHHFTRSVFELEQLWHDAPRHDVASEGDASAGVP